MAEHSKGRVIASPLVSERPPVTVRKVARIDPATSFAIHVARPLWGYKVELSLLFVTLTFVLWCDAHFGGLGFYGSLVVSAASLLNPWTRPRLRSMLHGRSVRRRFDTACRYASVVSGSDRTPKIKRITATPAGDVLFVRLPRSLPIAPLVSSADHLASILCVREVRVERNPHNANQAAVSIIRRDPLANSDSLSWPYLCAERLSLWNPIPVGIDEMGHAATVSLPEKNLLLGGEPGAGKSVALSQLVATAALDPFCELSLFDGKRVELTSWAGCASHNVGPSLDEAIDVLRQLRTEMDKRYESLLSDGKRKVEPSSGIPLHVVVCDELAFYLTMGERKQTQEFSLLMRDLVARGRAAGVVVLAATQKPSHDVIPTSLRDLFAFRWALRCTTPQASDTILGQGWASMNYSATSIDSACRGVGFLLSEGGFPQRIKSYYLSDSDLDSIARRAHEQRHALAQKVEPVQTRKEAA